MYNEPRAPHRTAFTACLLLAAACLAVAPPAAEAQGTPAAGSTPPDDTPTIKIGSTIFADIDNRLKGGNGVNRRTIAGLSYWHPHQGSVSSALLFDVENVTFADFATDKPAQRRLALHALIAF